jgi:ABC-type nitrate/sulfonate/bicarbonate transport system permease component
MLRYPLSTAITVGVSLAQIGEFSFILAGLGATLGLLSEQGMSLILASALISIALNPFIFNAAEPSAIFVIFITSLWSTIINTAEGVSNVPKDYLEVAQVLEMPRWKQLIKVVLPAPIGA